MAYAAETPRTEAALPLGWVSEMIEAFKLRRSRRAAYRETLTELKAMSDRDLADIGLSRMMIDDVALEAAEMAVGK